jgi:hypothetical protein
MEKGEAKLGDRPYLHLDSRRIQTRGRAGVDQAQADPFRSLRCAPRNRETEEPQGTGAGLKRKRGGGRDDRPVRRGVDDRSNRARGIAPV